MVVVLVGVVVVVGVNKYQVRARKRWLEMVEVIDDCSVASLKCSRL